jgi:hypothetical protein
MKNIGILQMVFLFLLIFSACEKDCKSDMHSFTFQEDKFIDTSDIATSQDVAFWLQILDGNKLVFTYHFEAAQCESVFDDEYSESLYFEVHSDSTSFSFQDSTLSKIKLVYEQGGAWIYKNKPITSGWIEGTKKSNNRWDIKAELNLPFEVNENSMAANFEQTFRK